MWLHGAGRHVTGIACCTTHDTRVTPVGCAGYSRLKYVPWTGVLDCLNAELLRRLPQMPHMAVVNVVCWYVPRRLASCESGMSVHYPCCRAGMGSSGSTPLSPSIMRRCGLCSSSKLAVHAHKATMMLLQCYMVQPQPVSGIPSYACVIRLLAYAHNYAFTRLHAFSPFPLQLQVGRNGSCCAAGAAGARRGAHRGGDVGRNIGHHQQRGD